MYLSCFQQLMATLNEFEPVKPCPCQHESDCREDIPSSQSGSSNPSLPVTSGLLTPRTVYSSCRKHLFTSRNKNSAFHTPLIRNLYREAASKRPAMLGAFRRSAKEASKTLGRASQLQQQRFLNIHEYQVIADGHVAALHPGVDFWLLFCVTGGRCYCRVQN